MSGDVAGFITARLADLERVALAASGQWNRDATEPEHWRWECTEDDEPIDVDLAIASHDEFLEHGEHVRVGLRSIERYPSDIFASGLVHLVIDSEELSPSVARHIAAHDPARVLRQVAALRAILDRHQPITRREGWSPTCAFDNHKWPCDDVTDLAVIWWDHPEYEHVIGDTAHG